MDGSPKDFGSIISFSVVKSKGHNIRLCCNENIECTSNREGKILPMKLIM